MPVWHIHQSLYLHGLVFFVVRKIYFMLIFFLIHLADWGFWLPIMLAPSGLVWIYFFFFKFLNIGRECHSKSHYSTNKCSSQKNIYHSHLSTISCTSTVSNHSRNKIHQQYKHKSQRQEKPCLYRNEINKVLYHLYHSHLFY